MIQAANSKETLHRNLDALNALVAGLSNRLRNSDWETVTYTLPATIEFLTPEQFTTVLGVAADISHAGIDPGPTLEFALPAAIKALSAEQFSSGLRLVARLSQQKIDCHELLGCGLPALALVSPTVEAWQTNLEALERFVVGLAEHKSGLSGALRSFAATAGASSSPHTFRSNVQALQELLAHCPRYKLVWALEKAAQSLSQDQFPIALAFASRLAHREIDPSPILDAGLPADFHANLDLLELLATRLAQHSIDPSTSPGVAELTRQAMVLAQQYEDFEAVLHEAVTHGEASIGGNNYYETVVDYPAWVELRPVGRRVAEMPLDLDAVTAARLATLQRSWLWRFHANSATRERALHRIASLRMLLPSILDRLVRDDVIEPTARLRSAYIIGSYPWVALPGDVDLFLVVDGRRDVTAFSSETLAARGIHVADLSVPLAVEIVGYQTLLDASGGRSVPNARRLALRNTLLYGSVLLAGQDLFEGTRVSRDVLEALRDDLVADLERAHWPELAGDPARKAAKQAWREDEIAVLRTLIFRSALNSAWQRLLSYVRRFPREPYTGTA